MIKNIMKNIGLKPVEVEEKEEKTGGMSKHWVQNGEEAMFVERTPEEEMKIWQEVAARQSNDKLKKAIKNRESKELNPKQKIILEAAKAELAKRSENKPEEKEPFLIQGMTKDKYIPWRMDAHGETKAQAESAWNHAEEQAKNKGNDYDHSALRG